MNPGLSEENEEGKSEVVEYLSQRLHCKPNETKVNLSFYKSSKLNVTT